MKVCIQRAVLFGTVAVLLWTPSLLAQQVELHPYAGGFWPANAAIGHLKSDGIYGLKGGIFFDPNIQLELHAGYINHFHPRDIDPRSRGFIWEGGLAYNFSDAEFPFPRQFTPYFSFGVGAIRTILGDNDFTFERRGEIDVAGGPPIPTVQTHTISGGDTFFTFSYGGGIKSMRLMGPVGLRADIRGRTVPNYYRSSPTWFEASGGINFVWGGER